MRSFRYSQQSILSTALYIFSEVKICSHPFLLTHSLFVYFRTPVTLKQTSYRSSYIFRAASIILKQQQPLEAATFSQKDFSEYLVVLSIAIVYFFKPLSANFTKRSNTLKQFVGKLFEFVWPFSEIGA